MLVSRSFFTAQVGQVIDRKLTSKGVTFTVAIEPQHRELVKGDSKFVVNSRVDVKVGLMALSFSVPAPQNGSMAEYVFCRAIKAR